MRGNRAESQQQTCLSLWSFVPFVVSPSRFAQIVLEGRAWKPRRITTCLSLCSFVTFVVSPSRFAQIVLEGRAWKPRRITTCLSLCSFVTFVVSPSRFAQIVLGRVCVETAENHNLPLFVFL